MTAVIIAMFIGALLAVAAAVTIAHILTINV
jgi:hypothetical protein